MASLNRVASMHIEKGSVLSAALWDINLAHYESSVVHKSTYTKSVGHNITHSKSVQPSGASLDFLRCRRLISPFAAVTKNPAVLSPFSFKASISSITSWGIRTVVICDLAFFAPVTITDTPWGWCMSVYAKKIIKKGLRCISPEYSLCCVGDIHQIQFEARSALTLAGPLSTM